MTMKLRDLVRAVRACKTASDERAIIAKESALIRTAFKEEANEYRHRNVAKLLYIHMLGYPTHFGQMECIKLIANGKYSEKRIGYLALTLLLDERQEVLTLVTNSLQMDLNSHQPYNVGLALTAIGNIGSAEIARDLANDVERLLKSGNPYIRKKAALCTIRMLRKVPEKDLIDTFLPSIVSILLDKNHNVLLTGVSLVGAVMEVEPSYTEKFTKLVPALVKILRKLVTAGYAAEYDVGGVTDPFLQSKILSLLRVLGKGNHASSEAMNNILAQVASTIDSGKNAANAVLYEAVNTIMTVDSEPGLRVLAVNILGKFLSGKDNNIKYVALQTLCKVVHIDAPAVQRHRAIIVDCLRDGDVSIRKRALELIYALVNEDNVRLLTKEMLNYLSVADPETKPDLCIKIAAVAHKFAPSQRWHIDTLITMLSIAGDAAKREIGSATLFHISHAPADDHAAIVHKLFAMAAVAATGTSEAQQMMLQVAVWCIGEFGQHLLSPPPPRKHSTSSASGKSNGAADQHDDLSGPHGEQRSEAEVVKLLDKVIHLYYANADTKAMVLTALLKLTARLTGANEQKKIRSILVSFGMSPDVELQQRSVEFVQIADQAKTPTLTQEQRSGLLAPMPLLDESVLRSRAGGETSDAARLAGDDVSMAVVERTQPKQQQASGRSNAAGGGSASASSAAAAPAPSLLDSLDELFSTVTSKADVSNVQASPTADPFAAPQPASGSLGGLAAAGGAKPKPAAAAAAPANVLDDLFSMPPASKPAAVAQPKPVTSAVSDAFDLLGSGSGMGAAPAPAAAAPTKAAVGAAAASASSHLDDLLGGLGGLSMGPVSTPQKAAVMGGGSNNNVAFNLLSPSPAPAVMATTASANLLSPAQPPPAPLQAVSAAAAAAADDFGDFEGSSPSPAVITAYESPSSGLKVVFTLEKPAGQPAGTTDITATFSCGGGQPLHKFVCQAAVPKFMKLTMQPASGDTVAVGVSVTQAIRIENSQHGAKPLAVRLKFLYALGSPAAEQSTEQTDVKNFPAGF